MLIKKKIIFIRIMIAVAKMTSADLNISTFFLALLLLTSVKVCAHCFIKLGNYGFLCKRSKKYDTFPSNRISLTIKILLGSCVNLNMESLSL